MKIVIKYWPILTLLLLTLLFFNFTLTGHEIFVTPDFGQSDILHNEYPLKLFMSQSLKNYELPLWNPLIGTGFPLDGYPSGLFNPINLVIFYILPMPLAYNVGLTVIFLTTAAGTYLFARSIKLSKESSLLSAITFTFSGALITHLVHFSVIQTLSFFPLELYLVELAFQKNRRSIAVLMCIPLALQLLTGFYQIVVYSLIFIFAYATFRFFQQKNSKILFTLLVAVILGFLIASIQLLPSLEFTQASNRSEGLNSKNIDDFPYPLKHIVTFIWPYLLGDPRTGTYPIFSNNWGLFWENTGFIGLLPLLFAAYAAIYLSKKNKLVLFFVILALTSFALMFGKKSLLYFLYSNPPLSLFRVPSRWIMPLVFSLSIIAGIGSQSLLEKVKQHIFLKKFTVPIVIISLTLIVINLFTFGLTYHARGDSKTWLKETEVAAFLKKDKSIYRIDNITNWGIWNRYYLNQGYAINKDIYKNLLESPEPNWNIVQNLNHTGVYEVLATKRQLDFQKILKEGLTKQKNDYTVGEISQKLLNISNTKYLVSPFEVKSPLFKKVFETSNEPKYFVYENPQFLPRARIVFDYQVAKNKEDFKNLISQPDLDTQKTVILESDPNLELKTTKTNVQITKLKNQEMSLEASLDSKGILIVSDSYYKNWKAYVDGIQTVIIPANLNQRAIILEKGTHKIKFVYDSQTFKIASLISFFSIAATIIIFIYYSKKEKIPAEKPSPPSSKNPQKYYRKK